MTSIIKVDNIQNTSGDNIINESSGTITVGASGDTISIPSGAIITNNGTATGFGGGKIGQVLSTHTNSTSFTTSSSTLVDVTGLAVSITPSATSSKVLIICNFSGGAGGTVRWFLGCKRGSTAIAPSDALSLQIDNVICGIEHEGTNSLSHASFNFLDSPNTTSATTYQLTGCAEGGSTFYVNRSSGDADSSTVARGSSSITVMEVLA